MISTPPISQIEQPRDSGVLDYVSPSRLNLWLRCPLAWKYRYVDGIRTPTTPALFLGQRCHAGMEVFYRHRMLGVTLAVDDVVARMDAGWASAVAETDIEFDSPADELGLKTQASALVRAYLDQGNRPLNAMVVGDGILMGSCFDPRIPEE